ncbi:MAG TPA: hypothetical protein GXZ82_05200 [Firmicutes bacterium]|nr:hypothetical protein [Bacillota bacterium]
MNQATNTRHHVPGRVRCIGITAVLTFVLMVGVVAPTVASSAVNPSSARHMMQTRSATTTTWSLNHPVTESVTVRTRLLLRGDIDNDLNEVWLASFVTDAASPNAVVALVVAPKTKGWLTAWHLQLHIHSADPASGSTVAAGNITSTVISLAAISLQSDTPYDTILSFNPRTGELDVRLTDMASGAVLYKGQHEATTYADPLYPAIGFAAHKDAQRVELDIEAFEIHGFYITGGADWALVREKDWWLSADSIRMIVDDQPLGIRLRSSSTESTGSLRFHLEHQSTLYPLIEKTPIAGESYTPLPRSALPPGASQLVMDYVALDTVWFSETLSLTVGQIEARFDRAVVNREAGTVTAGLTIAAQSTLPDVVVHVTGSLTRLVWDGAARRYIYQPYGEFTLFDGTLTLTTTSLQVPLRLPVPLDEPGTWQVQYELRTTPAIPVRQTFTNRHFSTYLPPDPSDEPFTAAILPDTQMYAQYFPEIFTRQTEWLAQNAQQLQLAFVLHLGDITNTNAAEEWLNAQRSMNLLDGVVGYALTVGNHDMGSDRRTNSRSTPLNTYFPPDDYVGLRGTFEPGRAENSYHIFRAGGREWLVVTLEFGPRDEVLAWADQVVTNHANLPVIIVTHTYTTTSGLWLTGTGGAAPISYPFAHNPGESVNDGMDIWQKFVRRHPNILMVISGHIGHPGIPRQAVKGVQGNVVYEMLLDYQYLPLGGEGWMGLMEFQPHAERVLVLSYSPYLNSYREGVFDGFTNHFIIDAAAGTIKTVGLDEVCAMASRLCR